MGLEGKDIFFTDECKIDTPPLTGEKRRLSTKMKKDLKFGENKAFDLMNKQKKNLNDQLWWLGEYLFMASVI